MASRRIRSNQQRAYKIWTPSELRMLKKHSRSKTPVVNLTGIFRRNPGTIRMKAHQLGIPLGHRR